MIYIFWTTNSLKEAKTLIKKLLDQRLIACANMIKNMTSIYTWEGEICEDEEFKIILKTKDIHFESIRGFLQENSQYEIPEISKVKIDEANPAYLDWLNAACQSDTN